MFAANCRTTAMGIMPHQDVETAIELAMRLDVPFWPQLPNVSFYEDMYAQASEHFPGISVDPILGLITLNSEEFEAELMEYAMRSDGEEIFELSPAYSTTYHRFLSKDLRGCAAIRGQVIGPVSFGFRIVDQNRKPIIYSDGVRAVLWEFIQKKANRQYRQLKEKNANAFVWFDEPGLGWVFSALSGYSDLVAKEDYAAFLQGIEGPRALHLCADINLPYLLDLGFDVVSFDAYQIGEMPREYASAIARFLSGGGVISWGIVPTDSINLLRENPESLVARVEGIWRKVAEVGGISVPAIAEQSLIAPARCCLKNVGKVGSADEDNRLNGVVRDATMEELLVEKAFSHTVTVGSVLRDKYC